MRKQELAAVRCAVKRSVKSNNVEVGYRYLTNWCNDWKETCNTMPVMKCFKKWADRNKNSVV